MFDPALFPARLKQFRMERHLSQERLAAAAGLCTATVLLLEVGRRHASLDTACRLATALEVSIESFVLKERK